MDPMHHPTFVTKSYTMSDMDQPPLLYPKLTQDNAGHHHLHVESSRWHPIAAIACTVSWQDN